MDNQVNKPDELDIALKLKPEAFLKSWWIYFNHNSKRWSCKNVQHAPGAAGADTQFEVIPLEDARERIMQLVKEKADLQTLVDNLKASSGPENK